MDWKFYVCAAPGAVRAAQKSDNEENRHAV
jgi:hypothetical protein